VVAVYLAEFQVAQWKSTESTKVWLALKATQSSTGMAEGWTLRLEEIGWQGFLDTASKACGPDLLIFPFVILNYNHLAQILNHRCLKGYDISGCRTH